jgi:hypothetical protein
MCRSYFRALTRSHRRNRRRIFHHVINERTTNRFLPLVSEGVHILLSNLLIDPGNFERYIILYVWFAARLLLSSPNISTSD